MSDYVSKKNAKGAIRRACFGLVLDEETEKALVDTIDETQAEDVRKNVRGKNLNDIYTDCDQFICSQCGIELRNWDAIERDDEINDIIHYEFVFKFCPNCGTDMRERKETEE